MEIVGLLLKNGANIGAIVNADNGSALSDASEGGHLEIVKLLLEHGANVNAQNKYAVRMASKNGHFNVVKLLLESGADVHVFDDFPLRAASGEGHLEIVKLLLETGANVRADNDYSLRIASKNGHLEIVRLLLENGANIHTGDEDVLLSAIHNDQEELVNLLLEYGANFSAVPDNIKNYKKYANKYYKKQEIEGDLTDWQDICRYLHATYKLQELKSMANKLGIKDSNKMLKKDLCDVISQDYDKWAKGTKKYERKCEHDSLTGEDYSEQPDSEVIEFVEDGINYCLTLEEYEKLNQKINPFTRKKLDLEKIYKEKLKKRDPRAIIHKKKPQIKEKSYYDKAKDLLMEIAGVDPYFQIDLFLDYNMDAILLLVDELNALGYGIDKRQVPRNDKYNALHFVLKKAKDRQADLSLVGTTLSTIHSQMIRPEGNENI
jgi:ankyrin repeat protein